MSAETLRAYEGVFESGPVVFHVVALDAPVFAALLDALAEAHPDAAVRRLSGSHATTLTEFFEEVRRALEIPYDAISWNVLNEALYDLTWMPANAYVLAVDDGHRLLSDAHPSSLQILGEILGSPAEAHVTPGHTMAPRHVLLQAPSPAVDDLTTRLAAAGIHFDRLAPPAP